MEFKDPESLRAEHEDLHAELNRATRMLGKIGKAARQVASLMHPHFLKEEDYVLIPLGILPLLANSKVTPEMEKILTLTDKLKEIMPQMLQEHQEIGMALRTLIQLAREENHSELITFAEKLILHAKTEEEVSYPTALLIGDYLKIKFNK